MSLIYLLEPEESIRFCIIYNFLLDAMKKFDEVDTPELPVLHTMNLRDILSQVSQSFRESFIQLASQFANYIKPEQSINPWVIHSISQ